MIKDTLTAETISTPLILLLLFVLAGAFFIPNYKTTATKIKNALPQQEPRFSELLLLGANISFILWLLFFAISNWVWSIRPYINENDIAAYVKWVIFERDGIESFVLYALMFMNIAITLLAMPLLLRLKAHRTAYLAVYAIMLIVTCYYFLQIGFLPPLTMIDNKHLILPVAITLVAICIYALYRRWEVPAKICAIALTAFAGIISIGPSSLSDLSYVLDPALRLMHGFKVSEVYFQYDLFLSFIALVWMKLNVDIISFGYIGQLSFFLFFIAAFFFSDRYFKYKGLSVVFIIALMLMRFYSIWSGSPSIIQASPIRLDLWLILVFAAYKKGIHHWLVGVCLGLLVLFHRNLGLIYVGAYIELLLMMFLLDIIQLIKEKNLSAHSLASLFMRHLRLSINNILLVITSVALCFLLFKELFSPAALMYSRLGIGMLPISKISFYWQVIVLYSCFVFLLVYNRTKLGVGYFSTAMFILCLAIGNSMYFFGRSHENNILNISGILVLVLFILFDILIFTTVNAAHEQAHDKTPLQKGAYFTRRHIYIFLLFMFIFLASFYYSARIKEKLISQYDNLLKLHPAYTDPYPITDLPTIREITQGNSKVYIQEYRMDFYYYYYGHYAPQGYFSPCATWVYKKDQLHFLQELLNKGYYIVYHDHNNSMPDEYLSFLKYNQLYHEKNMIAIKYTDDSASLPKSPSLLHTSMIIAGTDYPGIKLNETFTIEAIVKPTTDQVPDAIIMSNITSTQHLSKGILLQLDSGNVGGEYTFCIGTGTSTIPRVYFKLSPNKWNYITIVVNKEFIKVYNNGTLLGSASTDGHPFVNSDIPLTIGNLANGKYKFRGYIREIKITDGNIEESEIINTAQKLDPILNSYKQE